MIEKVRLDEAQRNVKTYITDGLLKTGDKDAARLLISLLLTLNPLYGQLQFYRKYRKITRLKELISRESF